MQSFGFWTSVALGALLSLFLPRLIVSSEQTPFVIEEEFKHVTCGSSIKLANVESGYRLHSHAVKYGSGSGQQSVTGYPNADDPNSYFNVQGAYPDACERGKVIQCGDVIRLLHTSTHMYLHSHQGHASPLSGQQEVSAYDKTDAGDNWKVVCVDGKDTAWKREQQVRLRKC